MNNVKAQSVGNIKSKVSAVHVFSTGSGAQHKEHRHGSWMPRILWALTSRSWISIPINVFLIQHRDGLVLFDTGLDPAIKDDPNYITSPIGRFLLSRIFQLHIAPDDKLGKKLAHFGFDAGSVAKAVFSHLHFDHVGGIADIPQAELIVSEREWAQLSEPHPEYEWILREHIEIPGAQWRPVQFKPTDDPLFASFEGCHDVMGDGSMILLPTPGHTSGSLSMLVRSDELPPILLIGDLAYEADSIFEDRIPGTGDAKLLRESYANVRALKKLLPDLVIAAAHDEETVRALQSIKKHEGVLVA